MINLSVKKVEKKAIVDAKGVPMIDYDNIGHEPFPLRDELLENMFPDESTFYDLPCSADENFLTKKGSNVKAGFGNMIACPPSCENLPYPKFQVVFGDNVILKDGNVFGVGVEILDNTIVGNYNSIFVKRIIGSNNVIGDENRLTGYTMDDVVIGNGNYIRALIGAGTKIGDNCDIAEDAYIGFNCVIGDNVTIKDGAGIDENCVIGDNVTIENRAGVEYDCVIGNNVTIKSHAVVRSGSVIPDGTIVEA